jgi:hypothetical protein
MLLAVMGFEARQVDVQANPIFPALAESVEVVEQQVLLARALSRA